MKLFTSANCSPGEPFWVTTSLFISVFNTLCLYSVYSGVCTVKPYFGPFLSKDYMSPQLKSALELMGDCPVLRDMNLLCCSSEFHVWISHLDSDLHFDVQDFFTYMRKRQLNL